MRRAFETCAGSEFCTGGCRLQNGAPAEVHNQDVYTPRAPPEDKAPQTWAYELVIRRQEDKKVGPDRIAPSAHNLCRTVWTEAEYEEGLQSYYVQGLLSRNEIHVYRLSGGARAQPVEQAGPAAEPSAPPGPN